MIQSIKCANYHLSIDFVLLDGLHSYCINVSWYKGLVLDSSATFSFDHTTYQLSFTAMIAIGRTLKALPLPISALALRQPSRIQKRLLSARAARTSQQQSAHARSGVPPIGKPPAAPSSVDQHGTAEPISLANGPYRQSKAVPERKLPANYNAVARRLVIKFPAVSILWMELET